MDRTYSDLKDKLLAVVLGLNGVQNGGQLITLELDCTGWSDIILDRAIGGDFVDVMMDSGVGKDFREPGRRVSTGEGGHTVDDGTNDLVNLAIGGSTGAGESGSQGGKAIDGLEGAASDGAGASKSSPPEGPGETARGKERLAGGKGRGKN